jgi:signal transduction histidine kinase
MKSIRRQLLIWQIGALLVTGLLISIITYSLAWNGFNRVRDYTLEQVAHAILRHGIEADSETETWEDEGRFVSQIWERKDRLAYSSRPNIAIPRQLDGWNSVTLGHEVWRTFTLRHANLTIQVASRQTNRNIRFAAMAPWLLLPLITLIAILGALIWFAAVRALLPLRIIRAEIDNRDATSLHPLLSTDMPEEVQPMLGAINDLLQRLEETLTLQRRFIADAAHELRSPLTAIRLQAQLAERSENAAERAETLAHLKAGVERAAHMVNQLLDLARIEPDNLPAHASPVALDALVKTVISNHSLLADSRNIDLGLVDASPTTLHAHPESLRTLLSNLIDNAVRYTPKGGRIDVSLCEVAGNAVLRVEDSGPGIPVDERDRVFQRFYRLAGQSTPGSGLGLAIVAGIVKGMHGSVSLGTSTLGGLQVEVRLPLRS